MKGKEFHNLWVNKSRELLARAEYRKQILEKRIKVEEERMHEAVKARRNNVDLKRKLEDAIKSTRNIRVKTWRCFQDSKKPKNVGQGINKIPVRNLHRYLVYSENSSQECHYVYFAVGGTTPSETKERRR